MQLVCVPPDRASETWPYVSHWIKAAMERVNVGSFCVVQDAVLSSANLLWLAVDNMKIAACAVTDIHVTEHRKVCVVVACGGETMKTWLHLIEGIEGYARSEGCSATRILGRKGWERVLDGYREKAVMLEKVL